MTSIQALRRPAVSATEPSTPESSPHAEAAIPPVAGDALEGNAETAHRTGLRRLLGRGRTGEAERAGSIPWGALARNVFQASVHRAASRASVLPSAMSSLLSAGGVQASIDKVFALRGAGNVPEVDLVNHHGVTRNNKIELFVDGTNAFPEMLKAIDEVTDSLHLSYFIFDNDKLGNEFADKLIAAKKRGVDVKVMVDGIGSGQHKRSSPSRALMDRLEREGVEVIRNHIIDVDRTAEVLNHPDHRKLLIVDGKLGFTGGMNVADHYFAPYHDLVVRVQGDAVKQMQVEWMTSWLHLGGKVGAPGESEATLRDRYFPEVPTGVDAPGTTAIKVAQAIPGEHAEIRELALEKIRTAKHSVSVENLYLSSKDFQDALIDAANRGVKVTCIIPGTLADNVVRLAGRQRIPELIAAGVRIFEYPGYCHGKVLEVDDEFVTIGSSNFDDMAMHHIYEMNLNVEDEAFAREIRKRVFEVDIAKSHEVTLSDITPKEMFLGKLAAHFSYYL